MMERLLMVNNAAGKCSHRVMGTKLRRHYEEDMRYLDIANDILQLKLVGMMPIADGRFISDFS